MTTQTHAAETTEVASLDDLEGRPHARLFDGEPQTIRLTLEAGNCVAPHQHPDREIVLHLLEGRLTVTLGEEEYDVTEGTVVRFDGDQYVSPEAVEDSTALLVLAKRQE
ncbi:cupin domain-containing protein [Natrononativus amylolyticus]|uniref:cupin domain-containing protein n=1 Tax=Natrononativus amylolyticus TaxID=2963434 RepID=UPI0020CC90A6|nr:cupin domain-containing protein [Natrononativus amylolyticus]